MTIAEILAQRVLTQGDRRQLARIGAGLNQLAARVEPYLVALAKWISQIVHAILVRPRWVQLELGI